MKQRRESTTTINAVLPDTQIAALRRIARAQRRTFSSVLREAVEEFTGSPDTVVRGGYFEKQDNGRQDD